MGLKKIFFVLVPAFNPNDGGVQRTTFKLGKHFTELGYEVYYYSYQQDGHIIAEYGTLFCAERSGGVNNIDNSNKLYEVLAEIQPELVINQMPYEKNLRDALFKGKKEIGFVLLACLRNSLFSYKSNVRDIVLEQYGSAAFRFLSNKWVISLFLLGHKWKHRSVLKKIIDIHDRFVLLTPSNRKELDYFVGDYKKEKVLSVPNSIPAVVDQIPVKEKIILHIGRLNIPQKRSDLLIPIWEKLQHLLPDWKFVIVGDGPYMTQILDIIKAKALSRIELVGHQKPEFYYEKAPVFLMTSAYEGFPNVLIEAQSFGLVPFSFDSYSAVHDIINHEKDGYIIDAYNVDLMAENIAELCNNHLKLKEMQHAALNNASRFTIDEVGKHWVRLFQQFGL